MIRHRQQNALKEIFKAGFENVTIDLIYGIPGMSHRRLGLQILIFHFHSI